MISILEVKEEGINTMTTKCLAWQTRYVVMLFTWLVWHEEWSFWNANMIISHPNLRALRDSLFKDKVQTPLYSINDSLSFLTHLFFLMPFVPHSTLQLYWITLTYPNVICIFPLGLCSQCLEIFLILLTRLYLAFS